MCVCVCVSKLDTIFSTSFSLTTLKENSGLSVERFSDISAILGSVLKSSDIPVSLPISLATLTMKLLKIS